MNSVKKQPFLWIKHPEIQKLTDILSKNPRHEFYFVGGCVRDSLLNIQPKDFDIASNFTPQELVSLLSEQNIETLDIGMNHGTVGVKINKTVYEVTSFRKDVETDGRHATVEWSTDIYEDAKRRDFTFNALYLNPLTCEVKDFFNGIEDLKEGCVKFIGNAEERIKEDYLRILRFFRFYSRFGKTKISSDLLALLSSYQKELALLSKERISDEWDKLLSNKGSPLVSVKYMSQCNILKLSENQYVNIDKIYDIYNFLKPTEHSVSFKDLVNTYIFYNKEEFTPFILKKSETTLINKFKKYMNNVDNYNKELSEINSGEVWILISCYINNILNGKENKYLETFKDFESKVSFIKNKIDFKQIIKDNRVEGKNIGSFINSIRYQIFSGNYNLENTALETILKDINKP